MLPHFRLYHVGLNGAAGAHLVIIRNGAASPALLVQKGVGRLGALWSFTNTGVNSRLSV